MKVKVKRAYDKVEKSDGFRLLADRLWPRGVSKASAKIDLWAKEVTPSNKLRTWFHKDKIKRFGDFSKQYKAELMKNGGVKKLKKSLQGKSIVTIVTGVKDIEHSHIPTLLKMLK
ncbi:MAG: DUF488 family protein [Minisyncoccia bacterium]